MIDQIAHTLERKAFAAGLDKAIATLQKDEDGGEAFRHIIDLIEKILGDSWSPRAYEVLRKLTTEPDSKWSHYVRRLAKEVDPHILRTFTLNAAYEAGFRGYKTAQANAEKYQCNIPWIILMDPTTACNLHCTGCWAAEYGDKMNLSFEDMDKIITEGKALGVYAYLFTGGEPLIKKRTLSVFARSTVTVHSMHLRTEL